MMSVSVVIPTYKRIDFLKSLLLSLTKQTYKDFEVIIVDDASPQEMQYQQVINQFTSSFSSLIYLRNSKNCGPSYSRNRGILMSRNELIAFVDDDDEWLPQKLEKQIALFKQDKDNLGIVYTWTKIIKGHHEIGEFSSELEGYLMENILQHDFIPSSSVMVKKNALIEAGLFDERLMYCEDWDVWTRIIEKGYTCSVVKSYETFYHIHDHGRLSDSPSVEQRFSIYYDKHKALFKKHRMFFYYKREIKKNIKKILRFLTSIFN